MRGSTPGRPRGTGAGRSPVPAFDYDLGVIGGGAAGLTVASGAAQLGAKTLLVEMRDKLGGDCLHYGCVPSKTLIRTANVYHLMRQAPRFGLPRLDIPAVDFSAVRQRIQSVIEAIQPHDSVERFCSLGARVEFGRAAFCDEHTIRLGQKTISAAKWVLATGSRPAVPPFKGLDTVDYLTNETLFSQDSLPEEMCILGAGPIAVEMAQAFQRLGCQVTIIQRGARILSKEDKDMADSLQAMLKAEGVAVHTNMSVREVRESSGKKETLATDGQQREHVFRAQALLVALGRTCNVDTLDLDKAGVEFTPKGVLVDRGMRTNRQHIHACGDVIGKHQFTHAAGYEGGLVVSNAVLRFPRKADYTWMPRVMYTDPELAVIGKTETQCEQEGIACDVWTEYFGDNDRSLAEGYEQGRLKLILDKKERPLGVQILGPSAGELLAEWCAVLGGGVKLSRLASLTHPYPTLAEINKRVAGSVMAPKIFSGIVRKGVQFLFNYKGRACEWRPDEEEGEGSSS